MTWSSTWTTCCRPPSAAAALPGGTSRPSRSRARGPTPSSGAIPRPAPARARARSTWTGSSGPARSRSRRTDAWGTLKYVYDAFGRRIEKKYDGRTVLKYIYDGDHCLAEYGAGNDLHRKYIYGPGIDQPVCMVESSGTYAGTYYYHCDGLGSVTALTNSSGNTVEVYEYDVYGRVGASDASHPNRIMFTGREYDQETGLYYYRARYYNPQIGRFLQTDPIGYGDGMNLYRYCKNNPLTFVDPDGTEKKRIPADLSYMDQTSPNYDPVLSTVAPQPSQWGVSQYFWWYLLGDGKKVDLENTGLLKSFQNDTDVKADIAKFEQKAMTDVEAAWLSWKNGSPSVPDWGYSRNEAINYNFDTAGDWAAFATNPSGNNLLLILGDGTFNASVSVEGKSDGSYVTTFTYYVADAFRDPIPGLQKATGSSAFGTPYLMYGEWTRTVTGKFE